jgi:hypothetical protein
MEAVLFTRGEKFDLAFYSVTLRIAYILCDDVISAGNSYRYIKFKKYYDTTRIEWMMNAVSQDMRRKDLTQKADDMLKDLELYKSLKKIKHLNAEQLRVKLSIESSAKKLFGLLREAMFESAKGSGLPQLDEISDDENFALVAVHHDHPERNTDEYMAASKILLLDEELTDAKTKFFCLTPDLFTGVASKVQEAPDLVNDATLLNEHGFLQQLLCFPNINLLLPAELRLVRKEIRAGMEPFSKKINEWISMVREACPPETSRDFFEKEIIPSSLQASKSLEENSILKHAGKFQNDLNVLQVYFGELPVKTIWDFYKSLDAVPDETWKILEEEMKKPGFDAKRLPVMAVHFDDTNYKDISAASESATIQPVKKSIAID